MKTMLILPVPAIVADRVVQIVYEFNMKSARSGLPDRCDLAVHRQGDMTMPTMYRFNFHTEVSFGVGVDYIVTRLMTSLQEAYTINRQFEQILAIPSQSKPILSYEKV